MFVAAGLHLLHWPLLYVIYLLYEIAVYSITLRNDFARSYLLHSPGGTMICAKVRAIVIRFSHTWTQSTVFAEGKLQINT